MILRFCLWLAVLGLFWTFVELFGAISIRSLKLSTAGLLGKIPRVKIGERVFSDLRTFKFKSLVQVYVSFRERVGLFVITPRSKNSEASSCWELGVPIHQKTALHDWLCKMKGQTKWDAVAHTTQLVSSRDWVSCVGSYRRTNSVAEIISRFALRVIKIVIDVCGAAAQRGQALPQFQPTSALTPGLPRKTFVCMVQICKIAGCFFNAHAEALSLTSMDINLRFCTSGSCMRIAVVTKVPAPYAPIMLTGWNMLHRWERGQGCVANACSVVISTQDVHVLCPQICLATCSRLQLPPDNTWWTYETMYTFSFRGNLNFKRFPKFSKSDCSKTCQ